MNDQLSGAVSQQQALSRVQTLGHIPKNPPVFLGKPTPDFSPIFVSSATDNEKV